MPSTVDPADPQAVAAFVRACGLGVVATVDDSNRPEAALVGLAALDDGTLIFDALHTSRKIANLRHAPRVAVVVGWDDDVTLQIEGGAAVVDSELRHRYGRAYNEQLPGSSALDDKYAVVEIRPTWVRSYTATADGPQIVEARWGASHHASTRAALEDIASAPLPEGADDDALAVAEALLGRPLPASTTALLRAADGIQVGETTLYGTGDLPDHNDDKTLAWMLPGFVVIGRAGPDRALLVHGASEGVVEVPDNPWDGSRLLLCADDPLDLVLRRRGVPLAQRPPDWAWPGVAEVVEQTCAQGLARGESLLTSASLLARTGTPSDPPLRLVPDQARAATLLHGEALTDAMNNQRPDPPETGASAAWAYGLACDDVADRMRDPLRTLGRAAPLPDWGADADVVRDLLTACVLGFTFEELAARVPGGAAVARPWTDMLAIAEAGHLPLGLDRSGRYLAH